MAKKIICIFAASLLMLVCVLAAYARPSAVPGLSEDGFFTPDPTTAPTEEPTPKPTDEPDPTETAEPTESSEPSDDPGPSDEPSPTPGGPTPRPTISPIDPPESPEPTDSDTPATPKPTHNPHTTPTPAPTEAPTPTPAVPSIFWAGAESSVITVRAGSEVRLTLVEGLADGVEFTGQTGRLPEGIALENDTAARSVRISGSAVNAGETEFALAFTAGGLNFKLNFRFIAKEGTQASGFPEGRYMIPFGGSTEALLPQQPRRREDDAV